MKYSRSIFTLLFIFSFSVTLLGNEWANYYFPDKFGSFWVYEDQNGNELTRYAVEEEEIDGETYRAFNYEPQLEDWTKFDYFLHPYFYRVSEEWITFSIGEECENAYEANFKKSMEGEKQKFLKEFQKQLPPELPISVDMNFTIDVEAQDNFYFLPTPANFNEEWTAMEINIDITTEIELKSDNPAIQIQAPDQDHKMSITLVETGIITGKETVETEAGMFEDCLKIEFHLETTTTNENEVPEEIRQQLSDQELEAIESAEEPKKSLTTVWLAPHVGIVKITKEKNTEVEEQTDEVITFELTEYEIKSDESEVNDDN